MSTANVARDLDLLRQAVGDRGLTYWGISYGSILGSTYANLFPTKVRALVLDGVADPVAWYTGRRRQARTHDVLDPPAQRPSHLRHPQQYFPLCDAAGPGCALSAGAPPPLRGAAAELLVRPVILEENGETFEVGYDELVSTTLDFLYYPADWPAAGGDDPGSRSERRDRGPPPPRPPARSAGPARRALPPRQELSQRGRGAPRRDLQ